MTLQGVRVTVATAIQRYLHATLGVSAKLTPWKSSGRLPLYLREGFHFYQTDLMGTPCLLMVDRAEDPLSPATVRKQLDQVQSKWDGELVYVRSQVASHQRKRLIEQRVPFLVPGNQLYIPMLGIDLREHFRQQRQTPQTFRPATQALFLHLLLDGGSGLRTPAEFAQRLGYTKMTMSRAFDELEAHNICCIARKGRERQLQLRGTKRDLWEAALSRLQSPVKQGMRIYWHHQELTAPIAGLSALARRSMLAPPQQEVYAFTKSQLKSQQIYYQALPANDEAPEALDIEIWSYDPHLFAKEGVVDPLSLYLALRDDIDERVQGALEEMMKGVPWS